MQSTLGVRVMGMRQLADSRNDNKVFFRKRTRTEKKAGTEKKMRFVLIDNDDIFRRRFLAVGNIGRLHSTVYKSLCEMNFFAHLSSFDLAILDARLQPLSGFEISRYVDIFFPNLPVVLIGVETPRNIGDWPRCVRRFVNKSKKPAGIINIAIKELQRIQYYRQFRARFMQKNEPADAFGMFGATC